MITSKKVFRPCVHGAVRQTERWLSRQAADGWKLIDYRHGVFTFIKAAPFEAAYFMYSDFDTSPGFWSSFYEARKRYGKSKHNSQLNRKEASAIFEIDPAKADRELQLLQSERNRFYCRHYLFLLLFSVIAFIVFSYGWLAKNAASCVFLAILALLGAIWSLLSIWLLRKK